MNVAALAALSALAVFGALSSAQSLTVEALAMDTRHWMMLLAVLAAGYVAGRLWAAPAQMVGLP